MALAVRDSPVSIGTENQWTGGRPPDSRVRVWSRTLTRGECHHPWADRTRVRHSSPRLFYGALRLSDCTEGLYEFVAGQSWPLSGNAPRWASYLTEMVAGALR